MCCSDYSMGISSAFAFRWMAQDLTHDKSLLDRIIEIEQRIIWLVRFEKDSPWW